MRRRPLPTYFVLCFVFTWSLAGLGIFAPGLAERIFGPQGVTSPSFYLAVYVPSVVGILLTAFYDGKAGVKALFGRLDPRRGGLWVLVAIALFLGMAWIGGTVSSLVGGPGLRWNLGHAPMMLAMGLIVDPGGIGEEFGWRGFALPRLLARFNPVTASVILGTIWGVWHLPAFYLPELPQSQFNFPLFVVSTVGLSIIMTWLALRSRQNLLVAITAHLMMNHVTAISGVALTPMQATIMGVAVLLVITGQLEAPPGPVSETIPGSGRPIAARAD
jgi:uncharacterized protein